VVSAITSRWFQARDPVGRLGASLTLSSYVNRTFDAESFAVISDYRIAGTNMPTMDECRRNAQQCLRWAVEAANDQQRETLLEIAGLWTQMELPALNQMEWTGLLRS
jgi:hypothetical protein